jgi:hypothetical protein
MLVTTAIIVGVIISVALTGLILTSLYFTPSIWRGDAPKEMQEAMAPLTAEEKRIRAMWVVPVLAIAFLVPMAAALWYETAYGQLSFLEAYVFLWLAFMVFNVIDLVLIDWLIIVRWQPSWIHMPEVTHLNYLNNYNFHFQGFLKGTVGITIFTPIGAAIVALI